MVGITLKKRKMFDHLRTGTGMPIRLSGRPMDALFALPARGRGRCLPRQIRVSQSCASGQQSQAFGFRSFLIQSGSVAAQRLSVAQANALQQSNSAAHTTPIQF
jgi:hypothetical protein